MHWMIVLVWKKVKYCGGVASTWETLVPHSSTRSDLMPYVEEVLLLSVHSWELATWPDLARLVVPVPALFAYYGYNLGLAWPWTGFFFFFFFFLEGWCVGVPFERPH